ncbi:MAG: hypothetical protein QM756_08860 [Polyangiaceae bacterium]
MSRIHWSLVVVVALVLGAVWWRGRGDVPQAPEPGASASVAALVGPAKALSAFAGDPIDFYTSLASDAAFKQLAATKQAFSTKYTRKPFGVLGLEGARFESAEAGSYRVHAERFSLGSASWPDLTFTLGQRGQMLELRPQVSEGIKPLEVDYARGGGGVLWMLRVPNQPARPLLEHYGSPLIPDADAARILATLSIVVPDAAQPPVSGNLEMLIDNGGRPEWPDAKALFGDTLSLGARVLPSENGPVWELEQIKVTTLLFALEGKGRVEWAARPSLSFDAVGERTCTQLKAHLEPSLYLEEVTHYLDAGKKADDKATLSMKVRIDGAQRGVSWQLSGGCGLTAR